MKPLLTLTSVAVALIAFPLLAGAEVIDGVNWADDVAAYTSKVQNYGGTLMDTSTEWWVTGPPDADADGNGYAWDAGDPDYVAGWRSVAPGEFITVYFDTPLVDASGDDLMIRLYGGPSAGSSVWVSTDGADFTQVGLIGSGTPGYFRDETFDFADGSFAGDVHYVKVLREENGPQTGTFIDAIGGVAVPEPGTIVLLSAASLIGLLTCARRKRKES